MECVALFDPERVDTVDDFLEYSENFLLGSCTRELQARPLTCLCGVDGTASLTL
jgi:hypothetical protein